VTRWPQVKNIRSAEAIRAFGIPCDDDLDGSLRAEHFAILPMEGWDGDGDTGGATDLVRRRWSRFGTSGAGLVWAEATAVRMDGRANPRQLVLSSTTAGDFAELRALLAPDQRVGLQLTHSGRWAVTPRLAYAHPLLDARAPGAPVFTDTELDDLVDDYVRAAVLAQEAGFHFVDVKHCHGYLLHELLSGFTREGRYGGSFEGRTQLLRAVCDGIRRDAPGLDVAVRLSVFDFAPFGPDGRAVTAAYAHAFGGDGTGTGIDLAEPHRFLDLCEELGITLVSTTAGSPYYCPHVQRPAYFPPSDGYRPPEDPLAGVARQLSVTAELARSHPALTVVGSGYSYLQDWLPNVGQAVVRDGGASVIGLGRMALSYSDLPADVVAGHTLDRRRVCRTFSDCTTAPRNGLVSGCYPLDDLYKEHMPELAAVKVRKR
jgi:NADPH2 dehydrogenase